MSSGSTVPGTETGARVLRSLRRGGPWLVIAVVLALISIPAAFDLQSLLVGLAVISAALGVLTAVFTWFDRRDR